MAEGRKRGYLEREALRLEQEGLNRHGEEAEQFVVRRVPGESRGILAPAGRLVLPGIRRVRAAPVQQQRAQLQYGQPKRLHKRPGQRHLQPVRLRRHAVLRRRHALREALRRRRSLRHDERPRVRHHAVQLHRRPRGGATLCEQPVRAQLSKSLPKRARRLPRLPRQQTRPQQSDTDARRLHHPDARAQQGVQRSGRRCLVSAGSRVRVEPRHHERLR